MVFDDFSAFRGPEPSFAEACFQVLIAFRCAEHFATEHEPGMILAALDGEASVQYPLLTSAVEGGFLDTCERLERVACDFVALESVAFLTEESKLALRELELQLSLIAPRFADWLAPADVVLGWDRAAVFRLFIALACTQWEWQKDVAFQALDLHQRRTVGLESPLMSLSLWCRPHGKTHLATLHRP